MSGAARTSATSTFTPESTGNPQKKRGYASSNPQARRGRIASMEFASQRYPFGPLAKAMCMSEAQACRELGVSGKTSQEYRRDGLSEKVADRLAVKAGLHPFVVWPEMADAAVRDVKDIDDIKIMSDRAKVRERQREWARQNRQNNPAARARQLAYIAAYRAASRETARAYRRRYYQANRERELARQREYDATVRKARRAARKSQADGEMVA